jgi:PTH1 family peptidyl-tRNA hydrolase
MNLTEYNTKVVVGLGNPGTKYRNTRHNIGFEVIDRLASRYAAESGRLKFEGEVASCLVGDNKLLLVRPLTYMNLSGRCVSAISKFYKINPEQALMVVCDDISLPLGKLRIRQKGSAGGQKGLNSILQSLGTQQVARLRIGVGEPPSGWDAADYVLGKFRTSELTIVDDAVTTACEAVETWLKSDLQTCMNQFN